MSSQEEEMKFLVTFGQCKIILMRDQGKWRLALDGMLSHMQWREVSDGMS